MLMKLTPAVNFINILYVEKMTFVRFFHARKTLMKLTPAVRSATILAAILSLASFSSLLTLIHKNFDHFFYKLKLMSKLH